MVAAPFTVTAQSRFTEDGVWSIDVRLTFRDGPPPVGSALLGAGRMALLQALVREVERGKALFAPRIKVHMEGHEGLDIPDLDGITH
jgi:hypothetical protein